MAHFFFHFSDAGTLEEDDFGLEFATAEEAYLEAVETARALWPELLGLHRDPAKCAFEIADERGDVLFRVPFDELLDGCRSNLPSAELHTLVRETHRRAEAARREVRNGIDQVHDSLRDMARLTSQLPAAYPRVPSTNSG